jgi:hypothetical protein
VARAGHGVCLRPDTHLLDVSERILELNSVAQYALADFSEYHRHADVSGRNDHDAGENQQQDAQ